MAKTSSYKAKISIQSNLSEIDKILDQSGSNEEILINRSLLLKKLHDINSIDSLEMAQKAKVRWAIEEDENTKYFHDILNNKRYQLAIRRVLVDGNWIVGPFVVKEDLERIVSLDEIKRTVWDCGTNKSTGPDGFTFEFFRRYWKVLKQDIVAAVVEFLASGFFSGIPIDNTLPISHLFFTDDDIFVGKWDSSNINTIVNVLKCFHMASGLKINFHKSKLMEIGTRSEEVEATARFMGCTTFPTPFVHLGVKVLLYGRDLSKLFMAKVERLILPFLCLDVHVGNGLNSLFWEDIWMDGSALKHRYPRLYALEMFKQISVAEKINHNSLVWSFRRAPRGGVEEEQQCLLQSRIGDFILPNIPDRWVCSLEASGEFSVKYVRSLIDDSLLLKEDVATRWVNVMPIKINVFAWSPFG
ncbi:hypothetical protein Tco_0921777 [Tanacetum coccineum]